LFTSNGVGEKISLFAAYDEVNEAEFVAATTLALIRRGIPPSAIAVLYRTNFQSRVLEEVMLTHGIPYQVLGVQFFERKEIKDVLSYLRAALYPEHRSDLKRIINVPPRGIGKVTLLALMSHKEASLSSGQREKIALFQGLLAEIRTSIQTEKPSDTLRLVIAKSGLREKLKGGTEEDLERLLNIQELVTVAKKYDALSPEEGIEALLTDAALATDQDEMRDEAEVVKLMTVHAAKGLEFDTVFVTGLEEGLFPHGGFEDEGRDEEEERRLFYVALTRARKKVFLSCAGTRTIFGITRVNVPSDFLIDLPEEWVESAETPTLREKSIQIE
jgi:DNA helicase-2/ATP-dependent DNA helicase PcrA